MSINLRTVRDRIRNRIRDLDGPRHTYNVLEVDQALASQYIRLQSSLPPAVLYTASAFTISANASSFTLPTTVSQYTGNMGQAEYAGDVRIQLVSTGTYLQKLSQDQMDAFYNGSPNVPMSKPIAFDLRETKAQVVTGRTWPGASAAEACNLWVTMQASDVRDFIGTATDDMDDVQVLLTVVATEALERFAAADLLGRMSEEDLKLRRFDARSAARSILLWETEAAQLAYKERERRCNTESTGSFESWVA